MVGIPMRCAVESWQQQLLAGYTQSIWNIFGVRCRGFQQFTRVFLQHFGAAFGVQHRAVLLFGCHLQVLPVGQMI